MAEHRKSACCVAYVGMKSCKHGRLLGNEIIQTIQLIHLIDNKIIQTIPNKRRTYQQTRAIWLAGTGGASNGCQEEEQAMASGEQAIMSLTERVFSSILSSIGRRLNSFSLTILSRYPDNVREIGLRTNTTLVHDLSRLILRSSSRGIESIYVRPMHFG